MQENVMEISAEQLRATLRKKENHVNKEKWNALIDVYRKVWGCTKLAAFHALYEWRIMLLTEGKCRSFTLPSQARKREEMFFLFAEKGAQWVKQATIPVRPLKKHRERVLFLGGLYILYCTGDEELNTLWAKARQEHVKEDLCYVGKYVHTPMTETKCEALKKRFRYERQNGVVDTPIGRSLFGNHQEEVEQKADELPSLAMYYKVEKKSLLSLRKQGIRRSTQYEKAVCGYALLGLYQRCVFDKKTAMMPYLFRYSVSAYKRTSILFWEKWADYIQNKSYSEEEWKRLMTLRFTKQFGRTIQKISKNKQEHLSAEALFCLDDMRSYEWMFLEKWFVNHPLPLEKLVNRFRQFQQLSIRYDDVKWAIAEPNNPYFLYDYHHFIRTALERDDWENRYVRMVASPLPKATAFLFHLEQGCPVEEQEEHAEWLYRFWVRANRPSKENLMKRLPTQLQTHYDVHVFLRKYPIQYYGGNHQTQLLLKWLADGTIERLNKIADDGEFIGSMPVITRKLLSEWHHIPYHSHVSR